MKITKSFLLKEYIINNKNCSIISKELGINPGTIYYYLKKYNITIRPKSVILKEAYKDNEKAKLKLSLAMKRIRKNSALELKRRIKIKNTVKKLWSNPYFYNKMLKIRRKQWTPELIKSKCHLYKGGKSILPYPIGWTKSFRRLVRELDNYTCQKCGKFQESGLHVHHIDFNKQNLNIINLISLCPICHAKVTIDRGKNIILKRKEF